jgi:hypothetical protein
MRGEDRRAEHLFSYSRLEDRFPVDHPLRAQVTVNLATGQLQFQATDPGPRGPRVGLGLDRNPSVRRRIAAADEAERLVLFGASVAQHRDRMASRK